VACFLCTRSLGNIEENVITRKENSMYLSDIYNTLNSKENSSFFGLKLELKDNLKNIANNQEEDKFIRQAAVFELDVLNLQLALDNLHDFEVKDLPFISEEGDYIHYFEERIKNVTNPFLLSRYNHILWLSKKHNKYAIKAIQNYLLAKNIVIFERDLNKEWAIDLIESLKRSFLIKQKIKKQADDFNIEKEIMNAILNFINDEWGFCICLRLLDFIMLSHKDFKNILTKDFINQLNQFAYHLIGNKTIGAISIFEMLIKISEKANYDATKLYENLGMANEARIAELNNSFASVPFCLNAMKIYNKLKLNNKVEELAQMYEKIKKDMKFGSLQTSINIEPLLQETQLQISALLKLSTEDIIQFLIVDKIFIPNEDYIKKQAIDKKKGLFYFLAGNVNIFDQRGNIVKICSSENDINWHEMMQTYRMLMNFKIIKLNMVLESLFISGKILSKDISDYMYNKTWLSHIFKNTLADGQAIEYTYLNILDALLSDYFKNCNDVYNSKNPKNQNLVMCIDSLTLKIEGLIRELFSLHGYPTIFENYEAGTAQEKDLNALLHDNHISTFLDPDELLFFKYIFTEQEGINLRNRVAHSLFLEKEYDLSIAHLLFISLLRLFKL
jgi:hypothetical protein